MKNIILCFLAFILVTPVLRAADSETEQRRDKLLSVINDELSEVVRLSKQSRHADPQLLLRASELYLEKARLVKERENENFIEMDVKKRGSIRKADFFRESNNNYAQAQRTAAIIAKKYPRFKNMDEVYYILGYNSKEFGQYAKARAFFAKAVKKSSQRSLVGQKSRLALAELLFNNKQYKEAARYYEASLDKNDKWWTKDAYNLAWCYYRMQNYNRAITLMREVHSLGKNEKYVSMSSMAERDMALFYAQAGRIKEAIDFYNGLDKDIVPLLISLARNLIDKDNPTTAEKILQDARKLAKDDKHIIEIDLILVKLYEQHGKYDDHLKTCQDLFQLYKDGKLAKDEVETLKYQVKKMAAVLQKQVAGDLYKNVTSTRKRKGQLAVAYFAMVPALDEKEGEMSLFYQAETQYASGDHASAIENYNKVYEQAKEKNDSKKMKMALDGMLSTLGEQGVSAQMKDKWLMTSYLRYLENDRSSAQASKIYQKVFAIYFEKKDMANAEKTVAGYRKNFPNDVSTQEAMIARMMEEVRQKKNFEEFKRWVGMINDGTYVVSKKYADSLRNLLLSMKFDSVEKFTTKGDKTEALKGYYTIFKDPESPAEAKKNAAYNIAVLFHELGNSNETAKWANTALPLMNVDDVKKFEKSFMAMSTEMFNRRRTEEAADLSEKLMTKVCREKTQLKDSFFKNAIVINLADNNIDEAAKVLAHAQACGINAAYIRDARMDMVKAYVEDTRWDSLNELLATLDNDEEVRPELIRPYFELYSAFNRNGQPGKAASVKAKMFRYYTDAKNKKKDIPLEGLDVIAHFMLIDVEGKIRNFHKDELRFPEKEFNDTLKRKFSRLDEITGDINKILAVGSGKAIVKGYQYLIESYQRFAADIKNFTPPGKSDDYVKSFQKSMVSLATPVISRSLNFLEDGRKQIRRDNILAKDNYWFFSKERIPVELEYSYAYDGIVMDRGGRK